MAERHRTTVDVRDLPRRLELRLVVERGHRVRLVELPQIDIRHCELVMLHELPDRGRDRDAHLLGCDGCQLHATKQSEDRQSATRGDIGVHHDDGPRTVGQLRGVARRRRAAPVHGLEGGEAGERRVGARAPVAIEGDLFVVTRLGCLVGDLHRGS